MNTFPFDHLIGCTPLTPCDSCKVINLLRKKLSAEDFNDLVSEIRVITGNTYVAFSTLNPAPLETSIATLKLTTRTHHCLSFENISTIGELVTKGRMNILKIPNFGRKSLNELVDALKEVGITF